MVRATLLVCAAFACVTANAEAPARARDASIAADTVKVGREVKRTRGLLKELSQGDMACYMTMTDANGVEFVEFADFDICSQEPSLIGQPVRLTYRMSRVLAASCRGNMDCGKTDRVALVVAASIIAAPAQRVRPEVSAAGAAR